MTTATAEKRKRTNKYKAKLPVKFKNLSVGDEVTTLGFSVSRDHCNIEFAEDAFCGKRIKFRILAGAGVDPEQGILWDDVQHDVEGIADVKKFSVTPKLISAGIAMQISSIDVMELTRFAKREGILLVIKVMGDTKDHKDEDSDEEEGDEEEGDEE